VVTLLPLEGENRDEEDEEARRDTGQKAGVGNGDDCGPHRETRSVQSFE
jgi:hypothetical protein